MLEKKRPDGEARASLVQAARQQNATVVQVAKRLISVPTMTPPGDTNEIVHVLTEIFQEIPGVEIEQFRTADHILNLVARVRGNSPGRRLVFNGHLDTFPLGDSKLWTASPWGEERDGRLYGLGISDMKGGVAAAVFALKLLAQHRQSFAGEVVGTFVGDEETLGVLGTKFLLDNVPHSRGDVMISGDIGSPQVLRFGEKGMVWLTVAAKGRSAHAAHVHHGDSAIERLLRVVEDLTGLRQLSPGIPGTVSAAIDEATEVSERYSGKGEAEVLKNVTVTFGTIHGGRLPNLVADSAEVTVDVRLPVGISVADIEQRIQAIAAKHEQVSVRINRVCEPTWTKPDHEVVQVVRQACKEVLDIDSAVNMRIGASDARLYRAAGIPSLVCGLTPHNLGAADEFVEIDELKALGEIFTLSAFDFLNSQAS
jgi:succinyl-diaminopimelate desuccinylase